MNRPFCALPKALAHYCESGCLYRERNFKHLKCPTSKNTDYCVAPTPTPPKHKNEMSTMQNSNSSGVQVQVLPRVLCKVSSS